MGVMTQSGQAREGGSQGADDTHIQIVAGMYGMPGRKHVLDIAARLQDLCGTGAQRCSVFCSDSSFGRYNVGYKPICRVTYRCGKEDVRAVEAWREEPILMRCPERQDEQVQPLPPASN